MSVPLKEAKTGQTTPPGQEDGDWQALVVEPARAPAVEPARAPAVESARAPAVELAQAPAVEPARAPPVEPARVPAVEPARVPAVEPASRRARIENTKWPHACSQDDKLGPRWVYFSGTNAPGPAPAVLCFKVVGKGRGEWKLADVIPGQRIFCAYPGELLFIVLRRPIVGGIQVWVADKNGNELDVKILNHDSDGWKLTPLPLAQRLARARFIVEDDVLSSSGMSLEEPPESCTGDGKAVLVLRAPPEVLAAGLGERLLFVNIQDKAGALLRLPVAFLELAKEASSERAERTLTDEELRAVSAEVAKVKAEAEARVAAALAAAAADAAAKADALAAAARPAAAAAVRVKVEKKCGEASDDELESVRPSTPVATDGGPAVLPAPVPAAVPAAAVAVPAAAAAEEESESDGDEQDGGASDDERDGQADGPQPRLPVFAVPLEAAGSSSAPRPSAPPVVRVVPQRPGPLTVHIPASSSAAPVVELPQPLPALGLRRGLPLPPAAAVADAGSQQAGFQPPVSSVRPPCSVEARGAAAQEAPRSGADVAVPGAGGHR